MRFFQEIVTSVRSIRAELNVPANAKVDVLVKTGRDDLAATLRSKTEVFGSLVGAKGCTIDPGLEAPDGAARQVLADAEVFVPLADLIDIDAERTRLQSDLAAAQKDLAKVEGKLANEDFLSRAPQDVVEKERGKRDEFAQKCERLRANLEALGG